MLKTFKVLKMSKSFENMIDQQNMIDQRTGRSTKLVKQSNEWSMFQDQSFLPVGPIK